MCGALSRATRTYGFVYKLEDHVLPLRVDAYCDADRSNCPDTSRSITGYFIRLNSLVFMHKSKKQGKVTTDKCRSGLIAASTCVEDLMWSRKLLKEIRGKSPSCSRLYMEKQNTISVARVPYNH